MNLGKKAEHIASLYVTGLLLLAVVGVLIVNYSPTILGSPTGNVVHGLSAVQGVRNLQVFMAIGAFAVGSVLLVGGSALTVKLLKSAHMKMRASTPGAQAVKELDALKMSDPASQAGLGPVPEPPEPLPPLPDDAASVDTPATSEKSAPKKRFRFFNKGGAHPIDRRIADIDRRLQELDRKMTF